MTSIAQEQKAGREQLRAGRRARSVRHFPAGHPDSLGDAPFWDAFRKRPGRRPRWAVSTRSWSASWAPPSIIPCSRHNPVFTTSVKTSPDLAVALVGFVLLTAWHAPPLVVVIVSAIGGMALGLAGGDSPPPASSVAESAGPSAAKQLSGHNTRAKTPDSTALEWAVARVLDEGRVRSGPRLRTDRICRYRRHKRRVFSCGFALTCLFHAYRRHGLNDRR